MDPEQSGDQGQPQNEVTGIDRNHIVAALSYLGILVIVPLFFVDSKDPFVKFHAKQGLVILIGYIVALVGVGWIPVVGNLVWLVLGIASIAGLIQSLQGKWWKIPVIGDLAALFKM